MSTGSCIELLNHYVFQLKLMEYYILSILEFNTILYLTQCSPQRMSLPCTIIVILVYIPYALTFNNWSPVLLNPLPHPLLADTCFFLCLGFFICLFCFSDSTPKGNQTLFVFDLFHSARWPLGSSMLSQKASFLFLFTANTPLYTYIHTLIHTPLFIYPFVYWWVLGLLP